jgi:aminoglycoside phosphotransferase (APT) family kinase protein
VFLPAPAPAPRLQLTRHPGEVVVGHGDWRLQNVSVRDGRVDAVYDWDSVAVMAERTAVAVAATTFTVDWESATTRFPTPDQTVAFVAAYASARGAPFTADDDELVAAEMVAAMAYGARCEHADPDGVRTDQRDRLAALGLTLLAEGLDALSAGRDR